MGILASIVLLAIGVGLLLHGRRLMRPAVIPELVKYRRAAIESECQRATAGLLQELSEEARTDALVLSRAGIPEATARRNRDADAWVSAGASQESFGEDFERLLQKFPAEIAEVYRLPTHIRPDLDPLELEGSDFDHRLAVGLRRRSRTDDVEGVS